MYLLYCSLLSIFKSRQLPAKIDTYMYLIISVSCATGLTILLISIFFFFFYNLKNQCRYLWWNAGTVWWWKEEGKDWSQRRGKFIKSFQSNAKFQPSSQEKGVSGLLWNSEIFIGCYCVARKKQIRCEMTKGNSIDNYTNCGFEVSWTVLWFVSTQ